MKRFGNLWQEIISFENLPIAAQQAQRGKRFRPNVLEFNYQLEPNLPAAIDTYCSAISKNISQPSI
jgi:hypothetical protein